MNPLSVWLVDDDWEDRLLFEEALDVGGTICEFHTFRNGSELMSALEQNSPTILFLDLHIPPPFDGIDILRLIKREDASKNEIVVVILSTSSSEYDQSLSYRLGANMYIVKPNNFQALISTIADICSVGWKERTTSEENFLYSPLS